VFAGHNPRLKGLAAAIAAVSAANRSGADVRLTAAGRQSRAATATHRLTRRARAFLRAAGDLAQPDLVALFHESDVLLHPAHYDPFPRVVLEGMACGCVPIVSRACGVADVLTDGVNAFLVDSPADVDGITAALNAARDAARVAVMRRAAIARAAAFDFDAHAATVLTWLQ
jgi:glycosyltransferase involved in cell wall biosynthesis